MSSDLFSTKAKILRIYLSEKDLIGPIPLYEWVCQMACREGISGATVLHGIGGYNLGNPVLAPELNSFRIERPVIVEIIDEESDLEKFVKMIENQIPQGLMTLQDVGIRYYGSNRP